MRLSGKAWWAAVLAPVVVLLAGCSGGSIVPGIGTDSGLGTIGAGTENPDAALTMQIEGRHYGQSRNDPEFVAQGNDFRLMNPPNPSALEAKQAYTRTGFSVFRTVQIAFNSLPVAGQTYTVGASGPTGVSIRYGEKTSPDALTGPTWASNPSGSVRVTRLDANRIDGEFHATLDADSNGATGTVTLANGMFHLKF